MSDTPFAQNFDYYQYGVSFCELYTYDKTWNDSSTEDTQKITGINTDNYWIQKYGEDFIPYRGIGWRDENWRRPNTKAPSGGRTIGENPESTPLDYINGSHPRIVYLGNRFISVCRHCCMYCNENDNIGKYFGSIPNKVVFVGPSGTTHEYQIENYVNFAGFSGTSGASQNMTYRADGTTSGPGPCSDVGANLAGDADAIVMRLTTDPEDDGIPPIKKFIDISKFSDNKKARLLVFYGYGILLPYAIYSRQSANPTSFQETNTKGFSPLGGDYIKQTWDGHSGTPVFMQDYDTKNWLFVLKPMGSSYVTRILIEQLKLITGDDEYEIFDDYTEWPYYPLENIPVGSTGATAGIFGRNHEISAYVNAQVGNNTYSLESNKLTLAQNSVDPPTWINPGLRIKDRFGNTTLVDGLTLYYNNNPSFENSLTFNLDTTDNVNYDGFYEDLQFYVLSENESVPVSLNFGGIQSNQPLGGTFSTEFSGLHKNTNFTVRVASPSGFNDITKTFYVRGFTSGTASAGLTYNSAENQLEFIVDSGTILEEPTLPGQYFYQFLTRWYNPNHLQNHGINNTGIVSLGTGDWPALTGRDGQTFDITLITTSSIARNDEFIDRITITDAGPYNETL